MLILLGGEKGGTGKTTLATNLAVMLAKSNKEVLIVDTDRQESASSWCYIREEEGIKPRISSVLKFGNGVRQELIELNKKYDYIIIDSGGRDSIELRSSLLVCNIAIIPLRPTQFDLWTLSRLSKLLEEIVQVNENLKTFLLINASSTNPAVKEAIDAKEYISDFNYIGMFKTIIKERITFHKAAACGKSVIELPQPDPKAVKELNDLCEEIFNEI